MAETTPQQQAIESHGEPLFIRAGAGTGKTHTLVKRLAWALSHKTLRGIDHAPVITFTEKAAGELLGRVRGELRDIGEDAAALAVDGAWISTIHSMCGRILTENALEVGYDPGQEQLSDEETEDLLVEAYDLILREAGDDEALHRLDEAFGAADLADAVNEVAGQLQLAPAGIEDFDLGPLPTESPAEIVRAYSRLCTEQAAVLDASRPTEAKSYVRAVDEIEEQAARLNEALQADSADWTCAAAMQVMLKAPAPALTGLQDKAFKADVRALRDEYYATIAELAADMTRLLLDDLIVIAERVLDRHAALKREIGSLDMNDLLIKTYRLLCDEPELARRYAADFDLLMVDEFQDTDRLQCAIAKLLTDEDMSTLTTVGDEQQSIYGFRNADLEIYRSMCAEMQAHGALEVKLDVNYRSHPDILSCVEGIFSQADAFGDAFLKVAAHRNKKSTVPYLKDDDPRIHLLFAGGYDGAGVDRLRAVNAEALADEFERLHAAGASYGDMCILLRRTSKAQPFADALRSRGISCVISGGSTFYQQPEVRFLTDALRVLENRDDDAALFELLASPVFSIDDDDLLALSIVKTRLFKGKGPDEGDPADSAYFALSGTDQMPEKPAPGDPRMNPSIYDALAYQAAALPDVAEGVEPLKRAFEVLDTARSRIGSRPLGDVLGLLTAESGWIETLTAQGAEGLAAIANIERFCDLVAEQEARLGADISAISGHFVEMLRLFDEGKGARGRPGTMVSNESDAVHIMTMHAAKGLEFPIVAVDVEKDSHRPDYKLPVTLTENGRTRLFVPQLFDRESLAIINSMKGDQKGSARKAAKEQVADFDGFEDARTPGEFAAYGLQLQERREVEEEQRLIYVATTRAREMLYLLGCDTTHGVAPDEKKKETALSDHLGLIETAFFNGELPQGDTRVKLPNGGPLQLHYRRVPGDEETDGADADADAEVAATDETIPGITVADAPADLLRTHLYDLDAAPHIELSHEPLSAGTPIYSYSSLAHAAQEEAEEAPAYRYRVPARPEVEPETVSPVGSAFHATSQWIIEQGMSAADAAASPELAARVEILARRYRLDEEETTRLHEAVDAWVTGDRLAGALAFPQRQAEYPFCIEVASDAAEPLTLEGYIDLLCLPDSPADPALIVDFKTGASGEGDELTERYRLQSLCYAYAVLAAQLCSEVEVVFVRPEVGLEEVSYHYAADDLASIAADIDSYR
ncbi:MAG: UvrD-helicase domain-containing protein [Coriobacteriaceae bacterium]|nr:UvrD-helicase domain-containing protein [Coriobacteriaceae bacterium]